MSAVCTGADFGCGRGEEDLDRAARGEAEEAVKATTFRQCALIGDDRRRTSLRDADDTERVVSPEIRKEPKRRGHECVE